MPRKKAVSPGETLIAYFSTATEGDARALLLTAQTIVAARFPPAPVEKPAKKATRRPGRVAGTAAASVQTVVDGKPSQPVTGRQRPPVSAPPTPTQAAAPTVPVLPDQTAGDAQ